MAYKYVDKYYNFHEKSKVWRNINSDEDVQKCINRGSNALRIYEDISVKDRIREDTEGVERQLADIEIALERIEKLPNLFTFTQEDVKCMKGKFVEFEKQLELLDLQRVSWD